MTKLKTLKDIEHTRTEANSNYNMKRIKFCDSEDLKQEAIKHIKKLRDKPLGTQNNQKQPIEYIINIQISNWIAKFFNIKERELK